jgi:hypothetical protein
MEQDTSPRERERYLELLRRMSPARRLQMAAQLSQSVRRMAIAGLKQRHPTADEAELKVRLTVRLYGRALAERVFGAEQIPADAV